MAKLGENTPHIIDATVDFMASSQAFREYLKKLPPDNTIPPALTDEHVPLYTKAGILSSALSTKADRIILKKTVNGSRNSFAGREALDKRSASVFPALPRDRFLHQFIFQCHNFLIHRRCGVVVPVEYCFHSPSEHTEHNQKSH